MNCPRYGEELVSGKASVKGTVWDFIEVGFSSQHLWFHPTKEKKKREKIIGSDKSTNGYRCAECKLLVVEDNKSWW